MCDLLKIEEYPVKTVLKMLLQDKTTKKNIIFATDIYRDTHPDIVARTEITKDILLGFEACEIQPRVMKSKQEQADRTRKKAEVFTPSWICNKMNNHLDTEWFGKEGVFNRENADHTWKVTGGRIGFQKGKTWKDYIKSTRLEITCGEAPYIVSRYDTTTGDIIPTRKRIGLLDRKMRVIRENTTTKEEWLEWTYKAFQSVYGYEWQGDNLLIARVNLIHTFVDYMQDRWNEQPTDAELRKVANIIVWNFWQMDGLKGTVPFGGAEEHYKQMSLADLGLIGMDQEEESKEIECRIYDWGSNHSIPYKSLKKGA